MDEGRVKAAVLARVREANRGRRKPVVASEFSLGSSGVRADLAIFAETTIGFEIKTSRDTLRRLQSQMKAYVQYFDHAVAIVASSHVHNVAIDNLYGASLWTYDNQGTLSVLHDGIVNVVENLMLEDVLTQVERRRGDFLTAMQARYGRTSRRFWETVARRSIRPDDLPLLSRFSDDRAQARRWAAEREARWAHWMAAQPSQSSSVFSAASGTS